MTSSKTVAGKRDLIGKNGRQSDSAPKPRKTRGKPASKERSANELMLEAWKKLYESRQNRLI